MMGGLGSATRAKSSLAYQWDRTIEADATRMQKLIWLTPPNL